MKSKRKLRNLSRDCFRRSRPSAPAASTNSPHANYVSIRKIDDRFFLSRARYPAAGQNWLVPRGFLSSPRNVSPRSERGTGVGSSGCPSCTGGFSVGCAGFCIGCSGGCIDGCIAGCCAGCSVGCSNGGTVSAILSSMPLRLMLALRQRSTTEAIRSLRIVALISERVSPCTSPLGRSSAAISLNRIHVGSATPGPKVNTSRIPSEGTNDSRFVAASGTAERISSWSRSFDSRITNKVEHWDTMV